MRSFWRTNRPVFVFAVLVPVIYYSWWLAGSRGHAEDPLTFEVRPGTAFGQFADSLGRAGIIRHPLLFRVTARLSRIDRRLHVGLYRLSPEDSPLEVLRQLARHEQVYQRFTVVEGSTLKEFLPQISATLDIPEHALWSEVKSAPRIQSLGIPTRDLEGYLFPETYMVPWGARAADIIDAMHAQFDSVWLDVSNGYEGSLSRHQAVTLASLVEAEARDGNERRTISSVFHNRLARKMRLQCDPTVIYAMGGLDRPLMRKDWEYDSPYNTYRVFGLPPGPIGAPGRASLMAALHPETTDYLYFVARGDGSHKFSKTLAEHENAFREFKEQERKSRNGGR